MTNNLYTEDTGSIPGHATLRADNFAGSIVSPLLLRAYDLWEALPENLAADTYARILASTNQFLELGDALALELLYVSETTRPMVAA